MVWSDTGAIVVARMGSRRFPGKALVDFAGKPLLSWSLEGALRTSLSKVVLATTLEPQDDRLVALADTMGIPSYRGSEEFVALRVLEAAEQYGIKTLVRLNGDSPFQDSTLVDLAVRAYLSGSFDFLTNIQTRSFPYGMGLEVFSVRLLRENMELILKNERWYEHVTSYFYNNPERFSIVNLSLKKNLSNIRLTVDEERDWQRLLPLASFFAKRPELLKLRYIVRKYRELVNEND